MNMIRRIAVYTGTLFSLGLTTGLAVPQASYVSTRVYRQVSSENLQFRGGDARFILLDGSFTIECGIIPIELGPRPPGTISCPAGDNAMISEILGSEQALVRWTRVGTVEEASLIPPRLPEFVQFGSASNGDGQPITLGASLGPFGFEEFSTVLLHDLQSATFREKAVSRYEFDANYPESIGGLLPAGEIPERFEVFSAAQGLALEEQYSSLGLTGELVAAITSVVLVGDVVTVVAPNHPFLAGEFVQLENVGFTTTDPNIQVRIVSVAGDEFTFDLVGDDEVFTASTDPATLSTATGSLDRAQVAAIASEEDQRMMRDFFLNSSDFNQWVFKYPNKNWVELFPDLPVEQAPLETIGVKQLVITEAWPGQSSRAGFTNLQSGFRFILDDDDFVLDPDGDPSLMIDPRNPAAFNWEGITTSNALPALDDLFIKVYERRFTQDGAPIPYNGNNFEWPIYPFYFVDQNFGGQLLITQDDVANNVINNTRYNFFDFVLALFLDTEFGAQSNLVRFDATNGGLSVDADGDGVATIDDPILTVVVGGNEISGVLADFDGLITENNFPDLFDEDGNRLAITFSGLGARVPSADGARNDLIFRLRLARNVLGDNPLGDQELFPGDLSRRDFEVELVIVETLEGAVESALRYQQAQGESSDASFDPDADYDGDGQSNFHEFAFDCHGEITDIFSPVFRANEQVSADVAISMTDDGRCEMSIMKRPMAARCVTYYFESVDENGLGVAIDPYTDSEWEIVEDSETRLLIRSVAPVSGKSLFRACAADGVPESFKVH
ncbi:MAG: hypothetical protein AAGC74_00685 [Verrucomicrobiota bacterium]